MITLYVILVLSFTAFIIYGIVHPERFERKRKAVSPSVARPVLPTDKLPAGQPRAQGQA